MDEFGEEERRKFEREVSTIIYYMTPELAEHAKVGSPAVGRRQKRGSTGRWWPSDSDIWVLGLSDFTLYKDNLD